nr:Rieske 2Fe-2S domain-containing protein [Acuticoccus mangrovi]
MRTEEIEEGRPVLLPAGERGAATNLLVLRHGGTVRAYRNACPHMGIPLDWVPERVLSRSGRYLKCTGHGALFRPEDGLCVRGPCHGEALTAVSAKEDGGRVEIAEEPR